MRASCRRAYRRKRQTSTATRQSRGSPTILAWPEGYLDDFKNRASPYYEQCQEDDAEQVSGAIAESSLESGFSLKAKIAGHTFVFASCLPRSIW